MRQLVSKATDKACIFCAVALIAMTELVRLSAGYPLVREVRDLVPAESCRYADLSTGPLTVK